MLAPLSEGHRGPQGRALSLVGGEHSWLGKGVLRQQQQGECGMGALFGGLVTKLGLPENVLP